VGGGEGWGASGASASESKELQKEYFNFKKENLDFLPSSFKLFSQNKTKFNIYDCKFS
jgi:hypothetical protein